MFKKVLIMCVLVTSSLFATYENDEQTLGNISVEAGIWRTNISGSIINNTPSNIDYKNDLGFEEITNITSFGLDLKNDIFWLPNIYVDYFLLNSTADSVLTSPKTIDGIAFSNAISTSVKYSEINTVLYGFLRQNAFEFNIGINIKKIDYSQVTKENSGSSVVTIYGPSSVIPQPYIALKIGLDFIDTVLKAEMSTLSFGDDEANSYKYSINYRMLRNMYVSYGYKLSSWKATNSKDIHEKYDVTVSGNYFNVKVLF